MFKSLLPWKHTKTKVMVPEQTMEDENNSRESTLVPCATCGRTFLPLPLRKHAPICEKSASKKRKIFDSLKQRVEGTDLAQFHQRSYLKRQESTPKTAEKPDRASRWEENHQKLVDAIRSAKGATREMSPCKKVQSIASSPHERCPHCERQFGPKAFDRHVEWCKEHRTRVQKSPANVLIAKERLDARIKYKVPPLNKIKKVTVKEKYSGTNVVSRTDSVCSVKSTPPNAFRRNLSVRKPKSVLDLGSKTEQQPAKVEDKTTSVISLNEITKRTDQNKSVRSKRYCPSRQRVNHVHSENLESITVAPVKFRTPLPPVKKFVTWKEVSEKSPENDDDESVIVVYENSNVFGKKNQSFIEELKEILTESDSLSGGSKSPCDIAKSSSNFLSFSESRSSYAPTCSESRTSYRGSLSKESSSKWTNLDGKFSELSIEDVATDVNEDVDKRPSLDADCRKCRHSREVRKTDFGGSGSPAPLDETCQNDKCVEAPDSDISIATSTECDNIDQDEEDHKDADPVEDYSRDVFKTTSSRSLSLKSISSDSLLSLTSRMHFQQAEITDKFEGVFNFNKTMTIENPYNVHDYDIPKKRRRLNSTFVIATPVVSAEKINVRKEAATKLDERKDCLLPKILDKNHKGATEVGKKSFRSKPHDNFDSLPMLETRLKVKDKKRAEIKRDTSEVFLSYQSNSSTPYDPFVSAERQLMELLECDTFKATPSKSQYTLRPHTAAVNSLKPTAAAKKTAKSAAAASKTATKKRASVIDPPACFQDPDDDFEMLENLINDQFNSERDDFFLLDLNNKRNKDDFNVILNQRKYSDDSSSVDSNLINENDNLTIPENFKFGNYSSDDTDTTIQNDNVDFYSVRYDKKIEAHTDAKPGNVKRSPTKIKPKSISSFGSSGDAAHARRRTKEAGSSAKKDTKSAVSKTKTKEKKDKVSESSESDLSIKPEDLFAVDDKMYAEYKIYEEMYLKEKELAANTKKQRNKNAIKSYGIEITSDEYHPPTETISSDSAYGSLNRNSPKPKTAKLSPLQRHRIDSASSSGSENCANVAPLLSGQQRMSKFCHECGNKYPLETAKFCPECGIRRLLL